MVSSFRTSRPTLCSDAHQRQKRLACIIGCRFRSESALVLRSKYAPVAFKPDSLRYHREPFKYCRSYFFAVFQFGVTVGCFIRGSPNIHLSTAVLTPTLYPQGTTTFDGRLVSSFSAHPKLDPQTGELIYFGYSLVARPYLSYGVISKEGEIVHQADIDLPNPVMVRVQDITQNLLGPF